MLKNYLVLLLLSAAFCIDVPQQLSDLLSHLRNKRVAFLTNPTGVDHTLTPIYQSVLSSQSKYNTTLVCFFAPEHGLRGDQQAGAGD
jgi:uncharacterized protein YbbC (DUF1343 family)